jgi:IS30 family transposase
MNVHKNARLTPSGRVLLVQRIEQGWSVRRAAGSAGVSERTAYRWLSRYRAGDRVLYDRSSAPHRCRHRLAAMQVSRIEQLRRCKMPVLDTSAQGPTPRAPTARPSASSDFAPRMGLCQVIRFAS